MDTHYITSRQNPTVKALVQLRKSAQARREGLFIVEGGRLIGRALEASYALRTLVSCPGLHGPEERALAETHPLPAAERYEVPPDLYDHLGYREAGRGLLAVMARRDHGLDTLPTPPGGGLYLVLEAPEKPGNIGAVCRSADAAGATGLIVCDMHTDLYNPNALTASTGALFSLPTAVCETPALLNCLAEHGVRLLAAVCEPGAVNYLEADYRGAVALAIGPEHAGLGASLRQAAAARIYIPMRGRCDSLNASTAAAILLFEASRFF